MSFFVCRRAFRGPHGPIVVGTFIDSADLRRFRYHVQERHIVEVTEQNFEQYANLFKEKFGIILKAPWQIAEEEAAAKAKAEEEAAAKAKAEEEAAAKAKAEEEAAAKAKAEEEAAAKAKAEEEAAKAKAEEEAAKAKAEEEAAAKAKAEEAAAAKAKVEGEALTVKTSPVKSPVVTSKVIVRNK